MAQAGGLKAAAKRTAFGDLSNAANVSRPSKDDTALSSKTNVIVSEKPIALIPQEKKSTALLRPAQRPLSVSGLKSLLHNVSSMHAQAGSRHPPTENQQPSQPGIQQANTKKFASKKSTAMVRDTTIKRPEPPKSENNSNNSNEAAPIPPVHRELLPPRQVIETRLPQGAEPSSQKMQGTVQNHPKSVPTAEESLSLVPSSDEAAPFRSDGIYIDDHGEVQQYIFCEDNENVESHAPEATDEALRSVPVSHVTEKEDQALQTREQERQVDSAAQHKLPPVSEPEEYWDEEDGNYEEEGYVTARSFKSRGENTTNGVTTVVFPKVNQKIKKELAMAKDFIESTRTVEEIDDETWDTSMVAEYGEEIFGYMRDLEVRIRLTCRCAHG